MAEPITFYQQGAAAGQQVDKYSTNPGCVDSKNLDIFSDSQCVKGTAWSTPVEVENQEWVDVDERGRFKLAANGNVYDSVEDVWIDHSFFDENAQNVDYQDGQGSNKAVYGTPLKLFVVYEGDQWRTITVITDRTWHTRYNDWVKNTISYSDTNSAVSSVDLHGDSSYITMVSTSSTSFAGIRIHGSSMTGLMKLVIDTRSTTLEYGKINITNHNVKWDEASKSFKVDGISGTSIVEFTENYTFEGFADAWGGDYGQNFYFQTKLSNTVYRYDVEMYIKEKWDYMLPGEKNFVQIDGTWYMFVPDQNLYEEIDVLKNYDIAGNSYYTIVTAGVFTVKEGQSIVALTKTLDYRLVFVNDTTKDVGYIYYVGAGDDILNFQQGWEFPGIKFINAVMCNDYSYVIAEERGIRGLYIFYNGQSKKIVGANTKYTEGESIIDGKQIYNFTGLMINWRGKVVAPTINGIYMYGENNQGQNVGSFVLKVDGTITELEAKDNELKVYYTSGNKKYYKILQDDVNIKNYEQDWSITYPVQIGTHLLEKEVRDLELSYNLPNDNTSLDVYINVNDYYFWTFTIEDDLDLDDGTKASLAGTSGTDFLEFVEKNGNEYTFRLVGDMPYQISDTKKLIIGEDEYEYTEMNHFKKIGNCIKNNPEMKEGKNRIFKITTQNQLPIVRKMQIRVDGHTDGHISPLLYSIKLLSDQQDR